MGREIIGKQKINLAYEKEQTTSKLADAIKVVISDNSQIIDSNADTDAIAKLLENNYQLTTGIDKGVSKPDDYGAKLLKYIPVEVITVYIALDALIRSSPVMDLSLYWFIFVFGIVATPLYLWRIQKVHKNLQLIISTVAFAVWIFAIGGPFSYMDWYNPIYGGIFLTIYTFLIPIIEA